MITARPRISTVVLALSLLAMTLCARVSAAQDAPLVEKIELEGLMRIPPQSVRNRIRTRVGSPLDGAVVSDDIKRIFRMGTFLDVQVGQKKSDTGGVVVMFVLKERPTIRKIVFTGNDELDKEDLDKVVNARAFDIASEVAIKAIAGKVKDLYVEEGYYLADVQYALKKRPNNMVDVVFTIDEGEKVKVKSITFLGNTQLPDDEIKRILRTQEGGWFSFLTSSGQFKKEALEGDLQFIRAYYLHKGFITVKVGEPKVTLSADKQSIDIVIPVDEGERRATRSIQGLKDRGERRSSLGHLGITGEYPRPL